MAVFIDVKSRFDDTSGRKAAEEAKRYFENAGTSSGDGFMGNFARAVEKDTKVRAAADKVANSLDKITAAEAKRATQLEKSKAITDAVAAAETKLTAARNSGDTSAITALEEKLTALRSKQVDVDNKLIVSATAVSRAERERASAIRAASNAYKSMGDDVEGLGTKLANLGSVSGALKLNLGLAALGTLPAAATAITEVAGALQQLAGAGFAVPGIFAGIAASVGVGALGMYGMTDAIKAVDKASDGTKASVEAANEAMAKLPASSADVVRTVVGLKGTLTDLSTVASTNMFDGFSAGLKGLAASDLPAITRGVDGISRGINQNLLQAMNSLGSSSSQGFLDRIFGNTSSAQSKLTAAIDPIVHAVGTLSAAGSDTLPRLADAVGKVAERFDRFISAADASGDLKKWIDEGIDGFTQLGNTALNIGKSFTAITAAAGGGAGLLGTLESATGKMSAFLNSAEGQAKLKDFFAEGRDMLGQLKDVATSAGPVLGGVFQSGITAANLWLPVIKQALDMLNGIPGGAALAVGAFTTWKTIAGVASLIASLDKIKDLLGVGIPSAATGLSGKLNSALALTGPLAAVTALSAAYDGILHKLDKITNTNIPSTVGQIPGSGAWIYDRVVGDKPWLPQQNATGSANPNQNLMPGPNGAASVVTAPSGTPYDPFAVAGIAPPASRGVGGVARPDGPWNSTPSVGVSGFTAPAITKGAGSPNGGVPYVDPSKYAMGDPLAGLPGAVAGADPTKIYDADSKVITAAHNVEQQRLANQVLEAKGNATQAEILAAKFDLQEKERALYNAQADDVKARTNQMKQATSDLKDVFAPLDSDFGISKGLPGIVENLVKALGDFALAGSIRSSPGLQAGAAQLAANGGVAPGLFNQQYFNADGSVKATSVAGSNAANSAAIGQQFFGTPGAALPGESARDFAHRVEQPRFQAQGLTVGDHAPDKYGEHGNGALDIMVPSIAEGQKVLAEVLADPNTYGAIFAQHSYGYGHGATGTPMEDRGSPTQNHMDHVHAFFKPGGANNINPNGAPILAGDTSVPGGTGTPTAAGFGGGTGGTQSVFVVNMPGGGFLGDGGAPGAPGASAFGPTPLGGGLGPDLAPPPVSTGIGTGPAPGPTGWGIPGLPSIPSGAGGQGYGIGAPGPGAAGAGAGVPIGTGVSAAAQPGQGGIGVSGDLMSMAGTAADIIAPGSSLMLKAANRTIQFAGQAAAIGVSGAMETFLPAGSPLAANSWFSKLAGGLSGAKAAKPNTAGGQGGNPQQAPPMGSPASGNGAGPPPGPGNTTNISVTNQRATEDGTGRDIAFHQQASHMGPGN